MRFRATGGISTLALVVCLAIGQGAGADRPDYTTVSIRGRVVWLAEALQRRFGIESVPEARERQLALQTPAGELHPIAEDVRGRSFRSDPRLREMDLELLVRRYRGSPVVQVVRIYAVKDDGRYELDYWCDICAIPMYELKPCDCCQGPVRLRERPADGQK